MSTLHRTVRKLERLGEARQGRQAAVRGGRAGGAAAGGPEPAQRDQSGASSAPDAHRPADRRVDDVGVAGYRRRTAAEPAADLLVAAGVATALPTAAAGLNDWSDTYGPVTRVGLVHATVNTGALSLYLASLAARACSRRRLGKALALAGFGTLLVGSYLGGHLSFVDGVNVNRTAYEERPAGWTPVIPEGGLAEGEHRKVDAGGEQVLLYLTGGQVYALSSTCSHMGGPLDEGTFADGCVTCPWHGSIFRLTDGSIVRGRASTPEPHYETRVQDGRIEVRSVS